MRFAEECFHDAKKNKSFIVLVARFDFPSSLSHSPPRVLLLVVFMWFLFAVWCLANIDFSRLFVCNSKRKR